MQTPSVEQFVGQIAGNYHIESFLGRGRLNAVYLAQNRMTKQTDALTLYTPPEQFPAEIRSRFVSRFLKEAAAVSTLRHPHILPIYEYGEWSGYPYLVTPYMTNGSLVDMLKQQGRYDHASVLEILEQVAGGLAYAHNAGIVHGTLKPANIIQGNENTMQVAGFGLLHMLQARGLVSDEQPYAHLLSVANTFLAAPEYLAPEVVQGQVVDTRSDIYALGAILFELLVGQPPFSGTNPMETAQQHVQYAVPSLRGLRPDVPVALESVVNQALERDAARRFQRVDDLVEAFRQVSRGVLGEEQRSASRKMPLAPTAGAVNAYTGKQHWQLQPPIVTGTMPAVMPVAQPAARLSVASTSPSPESWQLVPPVVTGKVPVVQPSEPTSRPSKPSAGDTGSWQLSPPIVTGSYPSLASSAELKAVKPVSAPLSQQSVKRDSGTSVEPESGARDAGGMKPFDWWSMPGQVDEVVPPLKPARSVESPQQRSSERRRDADLVDWNSEPMSPLPASSGKQKSGKFNRRQAVAVLASGGVIAAGVVLAAKMNLLHTMIPIVNGPASQGPMMTTQQTPGMQQKNASQSTPKPGNQTTQQTTPKPGNQTMPTQPPTHTGTVIGAANLPLNSSMDFVNPADGKPSLLIHLPNGKFVAYEKACTHEGVSVAYDTGTHTLVCPAHGAIFDPANKGTVLQGPATKPIAQVMIHVNGDGTVTTG